MVLINQDESKIADTGGVARFPDAGTIKKKRKKKKKKSKKSGI